MIDTTRGGGSNDNWTVHLGALTRAIDAERARAARAAAGLVERDPSAWIPDPLVQKVIANRLGWLDSPALMAESIARLRDFAGGVRRDGFTDVVLLGMGGSSLAPEVLRSILGSAADAPRFRMIDSTDPAAVESAATPPARTLYVLASKSGGTIEPNSLALHFRDRLEAAGIADWARHFVAITDEGTALANRARLERFRDVFINPSDIGGRYSALSFFGLVPAALMGQDIESLVTWGRGMLATLLAAPKNADLCPAVELGLVIGAAAKAGRDKLTLIVPSRLAPLGLWIEQLVGESTGKHGVGVVPVTGEDLRGPGAYGDDRLFVDVGLAGERGGDTLPLRNAGHPVVSLTMAEPLALGAEFVRWEIATAVAGAVLGVNPFDEPNVQQAKDATGRLLTAYTATGQVPSTPPDATRADGATLTLSTAARQGAETQPEAFLKLVRPGDYLAVLAYLGPDPALAAPLSRFAAAVGTRTRIATTIGYGPRYLHSTGQLHKGGANNGIFVLITAAPHHDVSIPGQPYSFGTLELAQALGDFASLDATGRRAIHIRVPRPDAALIGSALDLLSSGV